MRLFCRRCDDGQAGGRLGPAALLHQGQAHDPYHRQRRPEGKQRARPGWGQAVADQFAGPNRFGQLSQSLPGISQKVLTENLRALEQDGILIRTAYPEVPLRVEYG